MKESQGINLYHSGVLACFSMFSRSFETHQVRACLELQVEGDCQQSCIFCLSSQSLLTKLLAYYGLSGHSLVHTYKPVLQKFFPLGYAGDFAV